MPFIPPSLFSPDAYLRLAQGPAQSPFNVSLPPIDRDIPDIIPSLPSGDSVLNFFRGWWQAIVGFFVDTVPTKARQFAADHPEVVKVGGTVVVVIVAAIALYFVLPLLVAVFAAILAGLASAVVAVTTGVAFVFMAIEYLVLWVVWGVLHVLGFTAQGIAAGSIAAGVQSAVYGGFTTGLFSMLQSLGMTIGRLAAGVVTAVALVVA